ncbi:MAG: hypothetical protein IJQ39_13820 [Thermoguttaceae bacterium]|nr:hypothetical protein [Thermoguttaceae bacterium]
MTTPNDSPVELTQQQLEWATQKPTGQPCPSDASESQMAELESLEQTWEWFGSLIENAKDEDYLPANANLKPAPAVEPAIEQKPRRSRLSYYLTLGTVSAAIMLVCGFWSLRLFDASSTISTDNQVAQNTNVTDTTANVPTGASTTEPAPSVEPAQPQTTVAKAESTVTKDEFAWDEDDAYDTQLTSLSNSILSADSGDRWELSAMAEYTTVGYEMSQYNDLDKF